MKYTIPFKARHPRLLELEGKYLNGIVLSCRHKDILRCSVTKHFTSCFRPEGSLSFRPMMYCYRDDICIIGVKDRAGAWKARAFGNYVPRHDILVVNDVYGSHNLKYDEIMSCGIGSKILMYDGRSLGEF